MNDETQNTTQAMYTKQSATGTGLNAVASTPTTSASPSVTAPVSPSFTPPAAPVGGTASTTIGGSTPPKSKTNKKNMATIIGAAVLLLFLAVGGVLVYRFTQTSPEDTIVPTQSNAGSCTLTFTVEGEQQQPETYNCTTGAITEAFGAELNTANFRVNGQPNSTATGNMIVGDGRLIATVPARSTNDTADPRTDLSYLKPITGDFQTQIDVLSLTSAGNNLGSARLNIGAGVIFLQHTTGNNWKVILQRNNGTTGSVLVAQQDLAAQSPVTLRFARSNGVISGYYRVGAGAFTKLGEFSNADAVNIFPAVRSDGFNEANLASPFPAQGEVRAIFDNFAVQCPENVPGTMACVKKTYRDEFNSTTTSYQLLQEKSTFQPGETVVYYIETTTTNTTNPIQIDLTDTLNQGLTFVDSSCGANAFNSTTKVLTCRQVQTTTANKYAATFRAKINDTVANGTVIKNTANVTSAGITATSCEVNVTVTSTTQSFSCNSTCTTDSECKTANGDYTCFDTGSGKFCRLQSNTTSASCQPGTGGQTYSCNSTCATDEQCRTANADYVCVDNNGTKNCRLDSNRASTSCTPPSNTYACNSTCTTNEQCQGVNSNYVCYDTGNGKYCRHQTYATQANCQAVNQPTPTPTIGCNQTCETNGDCSNPDHVCYTTDSGKKCRLADYVNSVSCTKPGTTTTTTTTPTPSTSTPVNPEEVEQLPVAGTQDLIKLLGAGAGALILGGLFILLLL